MFEWFGDKVTQEIKLAACDGAKFTLEEIATDAKRRCPVDTGILSDSIAITFDEIPNSTDLYREAQSGKIPTPNVGIFEKGYVSVNAPYAYKQHEDLSLSHTQGEAKYLEKAFNLKSKNLEKNTKKYAQARGLL